MMVRPPRNDWEGAIRLMFLGPPVAIFYMTVRAFFGTKTAEAAWAAVERNDGNILYRDMMGQDRR